MQFQEKNCLSKRKSSRRPPVKNKVENIRFLRRLLWVRERQSFGAPTFSGLTAIETAAELHVELNNTGYASKLCQEFYYRINYYL